MLDQRKIPFGVVINKYRKETGFIDEVNEFCEMENAPLLGVIPYFPHDSDEKTMKINAIGPENESIFASIWTRIAGY